MFVLQFGVELAVALDVLHYRFAFFVMFFKKKERKKKFHCYLFKKMYCTLPSTVCVIELWSFTVFLVLL